MRPFSLISLINFYDLVLNYFLDLRFGINTKGLIPLYQLDIHSKNITYGKPYQATNYRLLKQIFNRLTIEHENYNFIDLGSGMGRTLVMAANYPFKKIIGVEFAEDLAKESLKNIEKHKIRQAHSHNIEVKALDILDFHPPKGPNLYFLYNPFTGNVLTSFLENLSQLNLLGNKDLFIYVNPLRDFVFHLRGFKILWELPNLNHNRITRVFYPPKGP